MKKFFVILAFIFFSMQISYCEVLKGSTSMDAFYKGFFGSWRVFSKMETATNYSMFNKFSVDIWNLSGYGDVLILENGFTGATSNIKADISDGIDNKKLKFTRIKEFSEGGFNYKHTESPEFTLNGDVFRGYDTFTVEKFDLANNLISKDVVKYKVVGQKIEGK